MAALKSIIVSSVVSMKGIPIARISSSPEFGVIGSVIKLDGGESSDDDGNQLTYSWSFVDPPPIGSKVVHEGFTDLDPDGSVVSFSPDVVGEYTVQLIVSNGTFESEPAVSTVSIRAILVPSGRGLVPDGKFVWGYLRDIWAEVENKEWFETLWSALIQITGASMIELYQSDFNKSIRDIQDKFQRRWLKYEPKLALGDGLSFYLGNHCAGVNGSSAPLDTYVVVLGSTELVIVYGTVLAAVAGEIISVLSSANPVNIGPYTIVGTNAKKTGYLLKTGDGLSSPTADRVAVIGEGVLSFSAQSKTWTLSAPNTAIRVGDFFHIFGPNLGLYRVTAVSGAGAVFTVDRPPAFASDPVGSGFVYRPIRISVSQADMTLSSSFTVPKETGDNDLSQEIGRAHV